MGLTFANSLCFRFLQKACFSPVYKTTFVIPDAASFLFSSVDFPLKVEIGSCITWYDKVQPYFTKQRATHCLFILNNSYLSLTLFNIYINPLAQLAQSLGPECHQYADSTQLYLLVDGWPDTISAELGVGLNAVAG